MLSCAGYQDSTEKLRYVRQNSTNRLHLLDRLLSLAVVLILKEDFSEVTIESLWALRFASNYNTRSLNKISLTAEMSREIWKFFPFFDLPDVTISRAPSRLQQIGLDSPAFRWIP